MVDVLIFRRWLFAHLLCTGIVLFAGIIPAFAASLIDIRIGEYDKFTRIVFESDAELAAEEILSSDPGQLTVVFSGTKPAFMRKIPIDRSPFIDRLEVRFRKDRLSITLYFSSRHARFDTFGLKDPPRVVLDVFWQPPAGKLVSESFRNEPAIIADNRDHEDRSASRASQSTTAIAPGMYDQSQPNPPIDGTQLSSRDEEVVSVEKQQGVADRQEQTRKKTETRQPTPRNALPPTPSLAVGTPDGNGTANSGRLQYYLVFGLVVITIGILLLLAFMLVFRHHWGNGKKSLKTNEYLQHQDKRIASINARVQEQIKRYDEV